MFRIEFCNNESDKAGGCNKTFLCKKMILLSFESKVLQRLSFGTIRTSQIFFTADEENLRTQNVSRIV